jgi:DNA-directed RNA polymerase subunit E'/Rpb7
MGKVAESGLGSVTFPVQYEAIVFRPFRFEVLDGVVSEGETSMFLVLCCWFRQI